MHYFYKDKIGGSEVQAYLIARELAKKGHEVYYVCEAFESKAPPKEVVDGIVVVREIKWRKAFRVLGIFRLYRVLRDINADIYYQRFASPYTGMVAVIARLLRKKFVWACSQDATVKKWYFSYSLLKHFKTYSGSLFKKMGLLIDAFLNDLFYFFGVKSADLILVQNNFQRNKLFNDFHKESKVIKSGHFPVKGEISKANLPLILWLNTVTRGKQPQVFIELARKCADLECKFVMVGSTSKRNYLELILNQTKNLINFDFINEVPFEESNYWFEKAALYICTNEEGHMGFPNTFIQAWLREVPVITLNEDPDDVIKQNNLGLHSGSFEQLVKDVRFLIKHPQVRLEMGRNARLYAEREHNITKIVNNYELLFKELLSK
jgi:glycosyltransferase involved in cell wall biosynthesis